MKISVSHNYEELSSRATADMLESLGGSDRKLVCVASGDSPKGMYRKLTELVASGELDISNWDFIGLDEWVGLNEKDEGSCGEFLNEFIVQPLNLPAERYSLFDGKAADIYAECRYAELFVDQHGGLDLAILGLGMNGHLGLNEPGAPLNVRTLVGQLAPKTIETGQKYFKKPTSLTEGVTLGLAMLLSAKKVYLLVSGEKKASILKQVVEGEISNAVPGSLLRNHPNCILFADKPACSLLSL
jgi:galactosamine-6-phosphate isomerase